jgi:hypothetical protein
MKSLLARQERDPSFAAFMTGMTSTRKCQLLRNEIESGAYTVNL